MPAKIVIGLHTNTKKVLHIRDAGNGLACDCICFECKEPLVANQGKKKDWHFSHHKDSDCSGGLETALHKLAKEIIVENEIMRFPSYGKLLYKNPVAEKALHSYRPDVSAELVDDGVLIYFEIFHRHQNTPEKNSFYKSEKLRSIEIDISGCPLDSRDLIKNYVLDETKNKRIIYWEEPKVIVITSKVRGINWTKLGVIIGLSISALIIMYKYFKSLKTPFSKR